MSPDLGLANYFFRIERLLCVCVCVPNGCQNKYWFSHMLFYYPINTESMRIRNTSILHEIRKRKANWIGHILRRNCLLKQVIEGKIKGEMEVTRIWGRRRKKLLDDLKDRRGYSHLKVEAVNRTIWRNRFGGGFGHVVRQNTEWMKEFSHAPSLLPFWKSSLSA